MRWRTVAILATAVVAIPGFVGGDAFARAEEPTVVAFPWGWRCMTLTDGTSRDGGGPPPVLATPRANAQRLGTASDPVIVADPLRVVNGHARVLHADGRMGWVRRDRLRTWTVAASPGLRCLPARMSDGLPGSGYAHPG